LGPAKELLKIVSREKGILEKMKRLAALIIHTKDSPDQIAGGVALGLFIAFAVPPGLQLATALSVSVLLRVNAMAAGAMVFVSNPLTMPIIYPFAAYLGSLITGIPIRGAYPTSDRGFWVLASNLWLHGQVMVLVMTGCLTIGAVASVFGFYGSRAFVVSYRRRAAAHAGHKRHDEPPEAKNGQG
jgi:hypothetical protein